MTVTATAVPAADLRIGTGNTTRFEGRRYGSGISYFFVDNAPGVGPDLHRHPYTETWVVIEGEATITLGGETLVAHAGDTAVVQPGVWHRFVNSGQDRLRMMCVHASDVIIQEFFED